MRRARSYFANTAARNCIAYGPGLMEKGMFGVEMPFIIQVGPRGYPVILNGCATSSGVSQAYVPTPGRHAGTRQALTAA